MEYNSRSTFSWSFTGFSSEESAKKSLDDMMLWFEKTYKPEEWTVTTSLSQTPYGYRAAMSCQRQSEEKSDG